MKKFKKGFSLAELLIAIGIVSVIAVMGTTIAKKNIERAFDLYVYTGFKGLQDGIAYSYANNHGFFLDGDNSHHSLASDLAKIFQDNENQDGDADEDGADLEDGAYTIKAKNNIKYTLFPYDPYYDQINDTNSYRIKMEIPYVKTRNSDKAQICLRYLDSPNSSFDLYPVEAFGVSGLGSNGCSTKEVFGNIQDRIDLLPFYIDDGKEGRYAPKDDNNDGEYEMKYTPKKFYSFREAACKSKNDIDLNHENISIDCGDIDGQNSKIGMLRVQNPRKAF